MIRIYFSILLFWGFFNTAKGQITVILGAARDNTIYQDATGNSNGIGENFFSGHTSIPSARRALIKFDIAAQIPAGAVITSVTLNLFCNRTIAGNFDINIHKLLADWGEANSNAGAMEGQGTSAEANDATWVSRFHLTSLWNSPGGDYTANPSASETVGHGDSSYSWISEQVVADVQDWLDNPGTNFGWILIGNETTTTTSKRFASRENPTIATRPQLSVTYNINSPVVFTFTGNGNWNDAANWSNNNIPPSSLPANAEIVIDPLPGGECVLNVPQTILTGGKMTVQTNKKFRITGNLTIQ